MIHIVAGFIFYLSELDANLRRVQWGLFCASSLIIAFVRLIMRSVVKSLLCHHKVQ